MVNVVITRKIIDQMPDYIFTYISIHLYESEVIGHPASDVKSRIAGLNNRDSSSIAVLFEREVNVIAAKARMYCKKGGFWKSIWNNFWQSEKDVSDVLNVNSVLTRSYEINSIRK